MNETAPSTRLTLLLLIVLLSIVGGGVFDILLDGPEAGARGHLIFELFLIISSLGLAVYLWLAWLATHRALARTRVDLAERDAAREAWRRRAHHLLEGLGHAVDEQFAVWQLTPTEREIAFLLLRGLSHKEIANRTNRGESTVRQHSVAVYRKAGLSGRAELSGFFWGELRAPVERRDDSRLE